MSLFRVVPFLVLIGMIGLPLAAQSAPARKGDELVKATLVPDTTAVEPGKPFKIGLRLVMEPGWHTYWKDPGDAGLPTIVDWSLPKGFTAGELQWPAPKQFVEPGNVKVNAYEGETMLTTVITPPKTITASQVTLDARVEWLVCEKICYPGGAKLKLTLPVGNAEPANQALFKRFEPEAAAPPTIPPNAAKSLSIYQILLYGVLGGLILNIMPCVLPVISLKIFGFVQEAHSDPNMIFRLGLTFAAGVLVSFWLLAGLVVALKSAGHQIGWGFQLQNPMFVVALCVVVLVFGLSLFGVFEVLLPGSLWNTAGRVTQQSGYAGALLNGGLATVLATPCTAPFLAPAIGYAFSRSAFEIFAVFTSVAVGLSLPYVLLTTRPGWLRHLPKPGPWMEKVKQFMGFLLIATLLWLLWVLGAHLGWKAIIWIGAFLLTVGIGCWVLGNFATPSGSDRQKTVAWLAAIAIATAGYFLFVPRALAHEAGSSLAWEVFSPEHLEKRLSEKKTVFLDFTAEWCLTCKVNESTILDTDEVRSTIESLGVVPMKADWTKYDPEITRMLARFDRSGVPLYVIFPGKDPNNPVVLPEVITPGLVIEELEKASAGGS